VGHYEGDTLVVDTVGIKIGRYAMVDWYGTPNTEALHVVERYRMLDRQSLPARPVRADPGIDRGIEELIEVVVRERPAAQFGNALEPAAIGEEYDGAPSAQARRSRRGLHSLRSSRQTVQQAGKRVLKFREGRISWHRKSLDHVSWPARQLRGPD
jgi:hypothetical protein